MTAGVRTRSTAYRRLDLAVYCWTLVKPRPQKRGLYAMVVSRSFVRLFVCSFVRLSVVCNANCCCRRGLIASAIRAAADLEGLEAQGLKLMYLFICLYVARTRFQAVGPAMENARQCRVLCER